VKPCIFCGRTGGQASDEHVIPIWARETFSIPGPVTISMRKPGEEMEKLFTRQHLNVVLKREICRNCNSGWLAQLEREVAPFLAPMSKEFAATNLDERQLRLVALWAVKTVFLFERSVRQKHVQRPHDGTTGSDAELAWLFQHREPPPMSLVWMSCYDCQQRLAITYEPSGAPLICRDGSIMPGSLVTFALGYVAFQVFSVDFIAAELNGAWRGWPPMPEKLRTGIIPIWPNPRPMDWPPPVFKQESWDKLVTWDGALRPEQRAP
jgi:hypothetical protein